MSSVSLHARLRTFLERPPAIHDTAYIAPGAHVIGDVRLAPHTSVWPTAVLRGDINFIEIGEGSNIQDGAVIHLSDDHPTVLGAYVTVGHGAILHACQVEAECLIGMHATVLDGAIIGTQSIIGAGALVPPGMHIPPGSMVMGLPAKIVRSLTLEERAKIRTWADRYVVSAAYYKQRSQADCK